MVPLTDYTSYADAHRHFSSAALWELFDGDRQAFNLAHECVDRHVAPGRVAVRVAHADGRDETITFAELSASSSRFAHWLAARGVVVGDRVAIMLEPSLAFYAALFGAIKRGAIAVPLFTLFGPDGIRLRVEDCAPKLLLTNVEKADTARALAGLDVVVADETFMGALAAQPSVYEARSDPDDLAVFQYTSGTTRELPAAVRHPQRAIVALMVAALYGTGVRPADHFFCPSSPAWGHGLWHGTIAPLALGIPVGTLAGRFDPARFAAALDTFAITNVAAAPTVYRMARGAGWTPARGRIAKCSFTGEPMDGATREFLSGALGSAPCSMYGSTEVGVVLVDYPGFDGYVVRPGALGSPAPGWDVAVIDDAGVPVATGGVGEIAVRRRGTWFPIKDRGWMDAERGRDRAGVAATSRRPGRRGRRDHRRRARPDPQGVRRRRARR